MDGVLYLLNQAGIALAQANQEVERLRTENDRLRAGVPSGDAQPSA